MISNPTAPEPNPQPAQGKTLIERAEHLQQLTKAALQSPTAMMMPGQMRNALTELASLCVVLACAVSLYGTELNSIRAELEKLRPMADSAKQNMLKGGDQA